MKKNNQKILLAFRLFALFVCSLILLVAFLALTSCQNSGKVPVYLGMTVSDTPEITNVAELTDNNSSHTFNFASNNGALRFNNTFLTLVNNNGGVTFGENKNTAVSIVFGKPYYAMKNEEVYIHIHLDNPAEYEILSFTLNGKKYSSNMFERGSDLHTIVLKYNVGDANGVQEYSIDAIKYVDGDRIKDVRMDGDKTVQVWLNDDAAPLSFDVQPIGFDVQIEPKWSAGEVGEITSLSLWEGESKICDLDTNASVINDLPRGKRLLLKAEYQNGNEESSAIFIFDTKSQSSGLAIQNGVIVGIGSCSDQVLYIDMPIDDLAFKDVNLIREVYTGSGCTSIGFDSFFGCSRLEKVNLGEGLTDIGAGAFFSCFELKEVKLPNTLTTLGFSAFSFCQKLTSIKIPDGVTRIEHDTFHQCNLLVNVELPSTLTFIGENAFYLCYDMQSVSIPKGVTAIELGAFSECNSLTDVYYDGTKEEWESIQIGHENSSLTKATVHFK